jgi:hypothetical protein
MKVDFIISFVIKIVYILKEKYLSFDFIQNWEKDNWKFDMNIGIMPDQITNGRDSVLVTQQQIETIGPHSGNGLGFSRPKSNKKKDPNLDEGWVNIFYAYAFLFHICFWLKYSLN